MIRSWHNPIEGSGMPDNFQIVWIKIRGQKDAKLGIYDGSAWTRLDSIEPADVVLWTPVEEPPTTLRPPDEPTILALKLASMLSRAIAVMPSPWDTLDLEAAELVIQAARQLRKKK